MSNLTISEAARQWNVSRQTIYNRLNEGEISVSLDVHGNKQIDVSEMLRVFGEPTLEEEKSPTPQPNNPHTQSIASELQVERVRREAAEQMREHLEEQVRSLQLKIERLERREDERDKREEEREKRLLLALENVSAKSPDTAIRAVRIGESREAPRKTPTFMEWITGIR